MKLITDTLREIRKGVVVDEASEQLAAVVRAVQETQQGGTVTLEISVKPRPGDADAVVVACSVKSKPPRAKLPDAIFFIGEEGDLLREDPNQAEMFRDTDGLGHRREKKAKT